VIPNYGLAGGLAYLTSAQLGAFGGPVTGASRRSVVLRSAALVSVG
jgi:hypothetical protein